MQQISPALQARIEQQNKDNSLIQKNNVQYVDLTQKPDSFELNTKEKTENNKSKTAKIIAISAAIVAAAIGIIYAVKKGKTINLSDMTPDKFKQIQVDKFSGKIKGKLKNGDKIIMEYTDGVLQKSTRSGKVNFEKVYETVNNEKIVKKTVDGITTEFNVTKTQQEVKSAQEKLKNVLNNKNLSSSELQKQTNEIKFKSNKQKREIQKTIGDRKNAEIRIQTEAEARIKAQNEIKTEAEARIKAQKTFEQNAKKAQAQYNKQFEDTLSNKSAMESADVFEQHYQNQIREEALERIAIQKTFEENANKAQVEFNKPFEDMLSHKSAADSANAIFAKETKKTKTTPYYDQNGKNTHNVITSKSENNPFETIEYLDNDGKIKKRVTKTHNRTYETNYGQNVKTIEMQDASNWRKWGRKVYVQQDGKLKSTGREYHDNLVNYHKTVEYLDNGVSKTTVVDDYKTLITFRDKKGNIININSINPTDPKIGPLDPGAEKIYETWYIEYAKLCRKYNVAMRPCGVTGGAGAHYFELLKRDEGIKAWEEYLRLENYRAQYDDKARLMKNLREFGGTNIFKRFGFSKEDIEILMSLDTETLKEIIKLMENGHISAKDVMKKINEIVEFGKLDDFATSRILKALQYLESERLFPHIYSNNYIYSHAFA